MPKRQLSSKRKAAYYGGMALTGLGLILFCSIFVQAASVGFSAGDKIPFGRAFGGMALAVIGGILMGLGQRGIAGSGLKLDPEEARKDLEPWSRMGGGMLKDALGEAQIDLRSPQAGAELPFDEQLRRLEALKRDGLISDSEYQTARKRIVDSIG